jgi:hypothetical protein
MSHQETTMNKQTPNRTQPTVLERIERKFFVQPRNIGLAYALLHQFCRPDSQYPVEQINSLYFDTGDLEQYNRSASGEYRKDKVRIRWYHTLGDYAEDVPVYVELKSRHGFTSFKQRQKMIIPPTRLNSAALRQGIIPRNNLSGITAGFGYFPPKPLEPVIVISYLRYRFSELKMGLRVSLDCHIRSTVIKPELGYGERSLSLAGAVIEIKGQRMDLPVTLLRLRLLDLDWSRFSKYASCLDTHLEIPGTIARYWPSGRSNVN